MRQKNTQTDQPDPQQLLELRYAEAQFTLLQPSTEPANLTQVMQTYCNELTELGFSYSHEIQIDHCIGKLLNKPARMLVFLNTSLSAYALLTDLYHVQSWVYFTHYFALDHRVITTCQPGALQLEATKALAANDNLELQNTSSGNLQALRSQSLRSQWKKHLNLISNTHSTDKSLLMDEYEQLHVESEAYRRYTDMLLNCVVLRQSDTQLFGFTHSGGRSYHDAVNSKSAKRPKPNLKPKSKLKPKPIIDMPAVSQKKFLNFEKLNYRNTALAASAAVFGLIIYNVATYTDKSTSEDIPSSAAALPDEKLTTDQASVTASNANNQSSDSSLSDLSTENKLSIEPDDQTNTAPEQFVIASDEDELWRIAVENAEFYLMSNDGDPAPWIRTARKMAAGFDSNDPRLARTYFLAALLEPDTKVAEQRYNRALSIQTKTLGLYHTETAQTLEALAWIAESARDDLEEAITHQRLALNVYRSIFGAEAEDTRAARWKLQYFEDRLEGLRPKSEDNRRLLPALARFAH